MSNEQKNKHMTLTDRIEIQECLSKSMTFKAIAKRIGKSPTTVSREVKAHIQFHTNSFVKTDVVCPLLLKAPFVCSR
ncbi:MAG: helix-turn-helix domain-containing protein [Clostridia bacterium]|nr:helix-turn-helix domain-containing protein [Clostridia bacterium]